MIDKRRKLTREKVEEIREKYKAGVRQGTLAREYGVSAPTICRAIAGRVSWKARRPRQKERERVHQYTCGRTERREYIGVLELRSALNKWLKSRGLAVSYHV